jgi:pimeloyl-ACP methyl ester carboxylesterase
MKITLSIIALLVIVFYGLQSFLLKILLQAPRIPKSIDPGKYNLPFQEVTIKTKNDKKLFGWFIPATSEGRTPGLVLLHGLGANCSSLLPLAPTLQQAGFSLLLIDCLNHGQSESEGFSSMVQFSGNLNSAFNWLQKHEKLIPSQISVIGHSLGGAAALLLGSQRSDISSIVSIGSFSHSIPMMRSRMEQLHIPYWPLGWSILRTVQSRIGASYEEVAPRNTIKAAGCPVLLIHGDKDLQVPLDNAEEIYEKGMSNKVQLWVLRGGDHLPLRQLKRKSAELIEFLVNSCSF